MVIKGMYGMGDNIYQRAFIREIRQRVYLYTSWPQLYKDLPNVHPVKPITRLRTQNKNISRQPESVWCNAPSLPTRRVSYGNVQLKRGSIIDAMKMHFRVRPTKFDLPVFDRVDVKKPYAVIRPVTVRSEWKNVARNPHPEYIGYAVEKLNRMGYYTVSVADLQGTEEWSPELPQCDAMLNNGQLIFEELMGLIQGAAVVVGGVGWIVPAAIAAGVPLLVILGGHGGHNAPEKITGHPMNLEKTQWIYPDNFCRCTNMLHGCNKSISNFDEKLSRAIESLCLKN